MDIISSKTGMTQEKIKELLEIIKNRALTFPYSFYRSNIKSAEEIIGKIDKKDVPYVALALSMNNDGIWSNDKHFLKQKKIRIWQTEELLGLID
jgi:predicted nucleic acid-binding protein